MKQAVDNIGNLSEEAGILQQIGGEKYHRFGPYQFANTSPKAIITGEATVVKDGLIRYYDAKNNLGNGHSNETTVWKDLSGNYDGIVHGGIFTDSYLQLDGYDDWVNLGQVVDKNNMTLEISFELDRIQEEIIFANCESGGVDIGVSAGNLWLEMYISGVGYVTLNLNEGLDTNRVYNITGTYDGKEMKLYVDGVLHVSTAVAGTIKNPNQSTIMVLGCNPIRSGPEYAFTKTKIYSARVYERALTQEEIQQNMNADRINLGKPIANNDKVKLTIKFDKEVQGFTAEDIEITNGTKGELTQITASEYVLEITDIVETEDLTVSIKENSYTDTVGNEGKGYTVLRNRDVTGPIPTITTNISGITNAKSITYNIKYNEPTTGFSIEDIEVTNGTKGKFTRISSSEFNIEVTNDGACKQKITVPSGACYDGAGNASSSGASEEITIITEPIITVNPANTDYAKSANITITVQGKEGSELSDSNSYQYYLSTSDTELIEGEWTDYISEREFTIGEGKTGTYYLYVKRVSDNLANISEETGILQQIEGEVYHRFGPYKFDNAAPEIEKAEVINNKVEIEANDGTGSGIIKYRYITSDTKLINPRITEENSTEVEAIGEITIGNINEISYIYILAEDRVGNTSNIIEVEVINLTLEGQVNIDTENGQGEVDLNWKINIAGEKTYKVYQKGEEEEEWTAVGETNENKITLSTAQDIAKPNTPDIQVNPINQDDKITIKQTATDNGSTYKFYVEACDRTDTNIVLATSEEITKEVKTGIKGYYYKIDETPENTGDNIENETYIEEDTIELDKSDIGKDIKLKAIDLAGNIGEESSIQINVPSKVTIQLNGGLIEGNTGEIQIEGVVGETIELGIPQKEGYTFTGWTATEGTIEGTKYTFGEKAGEVTAGWKINSYEYTVEYYYEGTKDESKTVTGQAEYGTTIKIYEAKIKEGYKFEKTENLPLTITAQPSNNVIKVYYVTDQSKTKELSYTVEYYKEGQKVEKDTQIVKETVQVLQPNTIQVNQEAINTTNKYPGYKCTNTDPETIPQTVENGTIIKVYYVIDENNTKELSYTVEYYKEGQKVDGDVEVIKETVQVLQPNTLQVKQDGINMTDKYTGYKFERTNPEVIPQTVENGATIKVYYVKQNNLSYKVNYLDRETNDIIKEQKIVANQTFEDVVETNREIIEIEGYIDGETDKEKITITANNEENVINIYYTKRKDLSYTVNYLNENGEQIHIPQVVENQEYGKVITGKEIAIEIEGHTYDESTEQETLTIGVEIDKNIINIYYIKRSDIKYTINYLEKDTNEVIHEAKEEEGVYGGIIKAETEKIDIPGYTNATADKEEITIEADETKNVINIYYEKRTDIKYKVEYYYNGEKDESKTVKGIATYKEIIDSYEDKIIEGYVLVEEKGIPLTIVAKEEKNVIEIHYAKKAQIKVQYIEKDTDRLIEEIVEEGYVGKEYNTISKNIEGYVLVEEPEEKNITMTEDEVIVKYYYKHVTKGVIEKHIDIDTGEILFNTIHEGNEGDEYKIEPKEIEGYDVVQEKLPTNNEGTMEKDVITVSYYYKKKAVVIVTVKYIDKDTNDVLAEDIVIKGYEGKEYKTEKKEISGYEFVEIIGKREGKMTTNEEVIYYYQKEKVPGEDVNTPGGNTGENTGGNGGTNGSDGETTDTTISDGKLPSAGLSKQQITIISFVAITITTVTLAVFAIKGTIIYNKFKN